MKKRSDAELVAEAKRDRSAYARIYERYYRNVYNYLWYRVGHDREVAEDLAQETFCRAFEALPRFTDQGKTYLAYLLTIAHNLLVNHYRKPRPISIEATGVDVPEEIWSDIETRDHIRALWRAIQQLSPIERDVLYLKYRKDYSIREIASIIDKSDNATKLILSRARKRLAAHPYLAAISGFKDTRVKRPQSRYRQR